MQQAATDPILHLARPALAALVRRAFVLGLATGVGILALLWIGYHALGGH